MPVRKPAWLNKVQQKYLTAQAAVRKSSSALYQKAFSPTTGSLGTLNLRGRGVSKVELVGNQTVRVTPLNRPSFDPKGVNGQTFNLAELPADIRSQVNERIREVEANNRSAKRKQFVSAVKEKVNKGRQKLTDRFNSSFRVVPEKIPPTHSYIKDLDVGRPSRMDVQVLPGKKVVLMYDYKTHKGDSKNAHEEWDWKDLPAYARQRIVAASEVNKKTDQRFAQIAKKMTTDLNQIKRKEKIKTVANTSRLAIKRAYRTGFGVKSLIQKGKRAIELNRKKTIGKVLIQSTAMVGGNKFLRGTPVTMWVEVEVKENSAGKRFFGKVLGYRRPLLVRGRYEGVGGPVNFRSIGTDRSIKKQLNEYALGHHPDAFKPEDILPI